MTPEERKVRVKLVYHAPPCVKNDLQFLLDHGYAFPLRADGTRQALLDWAEKIHALTDVVCEEVIAREEHAEQVWLDLIRSHDIAIPRDSRKSGLSKKRKVRS